MRCGPRPSSNNNAGSRSLITFSRIFRLDLFLNFHFSCFLSNFRQPPNDVEMALGGTLLPSISTFASGPTIKTKSIGSANLVSSKPTSSLHVKISNNAAHSLQFIKGCFPVCYYGQSQGVHHFKLASAETWSTKDHFAQYMAIIFRHNRLLICCKRLQQFDCADILQFCFLRSVLLASLESA